MTEQKAQELRVRVHKTVETWFDEHGDDALLSKIRFEVNITYHEPGDYTDRSVNAGPELPQP